MVVVDREGGGARELINEKPTTPHAIQHMFPNNVTLNSSTSLFEIGQS